MTKQSEIPQQPRSPETGRWPKGTSGNPAGRPRGRRNKSTLLREEAANAADHEQLVGKLKALAMNGDWSAMKLYIKLYMELHRSQERLIHLPLPELKTPEDRVEANRIILEAVSNGKLTIERATAYTNLVARHEATRENVARNGQKTIAGIPASKLARLEALQFPVAAGDQDETGYLNLGPFEDEVDFEYPGSAGLPVSERQPRYTDPAKSAPASDSPARTCAEQLSTERQILPEQGKCGIAKEDVSVNHQSATSKPVPTESTEPSNPCAPVGAAPALSPCQALLAENESAIDREGIADASSTSFSSILDNLSHAIAPRVLSGRKPEPIAESNRGWMDTDSPTNAPQSQPLVLETAKPKDIQTLPPPASTQQPRPPRNPPCRLDELVTRFL